MRSALGLILGSLIATVFITGVWFFTLSHVELAGHRTSAATRPAKPLMASAKADREPLRQGAKDDVEFTAALPDKQAALPAPVQQNQACANPDALGIGRVVEIDTTGGPGFGAGHLKPVDFLTDKEVVLTFDDGPWPHNTPAVLKALGDECTKGLFFSIGKHATYHPALLRQVLAEGHTVGSHTWSHVNLKGKKVTEQRAKDEVEKGFSAVKFALGTDPAPFFRFPQLQYSRPVVDYFGNRNVAMFAADIDSSDYKKTSTPDKIITTVMTELDKRGKGIILLHDFQKNTAEALPTLLRRLKEGGYKVVQVKAKAPFQTLPEYDQAFVKVEKTPTANGRPVSSVVQTVSQ